MTNELLAPGQAKPDVSDAYRYRREIEISVQGSCALFVSRLMEVEERVG
jgi:hypothetical protein